MTISKAFAIRNGAIIARDTDGSEYTIAPLTTNEWAITKISDGVGVATIECEDSLSNLGELQSKVFNALAIRAAAKHPASQNEV